MAARARQTGPCGQITLRHFDPNARGLECSTPASRLMPSSTLANASNRHCHEAVGLLAGQAVPLCGARTSSRSVTAHQSLHVDASPRSEVITPRQLSHTSWSAPLGPDR